MANRDDVNAKLNSGIVEGLSGTVRFLRITKTGKLKLVNPHPWRGRKRVTRKKKEGEGTSKSG